MAKKNRIFSSNTPFVSSYYSKLGQEERELRKAVDILYKDQKILNPAPKLTGSTKSDYRKATAEMKELISQAVQEDILRIKHSTSESEIKRNKIEALLDSSYGKKRNKILEDLERAHELDKEKDYDEREELYNELFSDADKVTLIEIKKDLDTRKRGGDTPF